MTQSPTRISHCIPKAVVTCGNQDWFKCLATCSATLSASLPSYSSPANIQRSST